MFIDDHIHENITGKHLAGNHLFLAVPHLNFVLNRNNDIENHLAHARRVHEPLEVRLNLVLIARIGMDDIPCPVRVCLSQIEFFLIRHIPHLVMQNNLKNTGKNGIANPNQRTDNDNRDTDNPSIGGKFTTRRP